MRKEIALTFNNNENKQYIERSFEFYNNERFIKKDYFFIYQRECISVNTNYLTDLAYFPHKYASFSVFSLDTFVDKTREKISINNNYIPVFQNKSLKVFVKINQIFRTSRNDIRFFKQTKLAFPTFKFHMKIYENILIYPKFKHYMRLYQNIFMTQINNNKLKRIPNQDVLKKEWFAENFNTFINNKIINDDNAFETDTVFLEYTNRFKNVNVLNNIFAKQYYFLNTYNHEFLKETTKMFINLYEYNFAHHIIIRNTNLFDNISLSENERNTNYYENNFAKPDKIYLDYFDTSYSAFKNDVDKYINYFENVNAKMNDTLYISIIQNINFGIKNISSSNSVFKDPVSFILSYKNIFYLLNDSFKKSYKYLFETINYEHFNKIKKDLYKQDENVFINKTNKYVYETDNTEFINLYYKFAMDLNNNFISKKQKKIFIKGLFVNLQKKSFIMFLYKENNFLLKYNKFLYKYKENNLYNKISYGLKNKDYSDAVSNSNKTAWLYNNLYNTRKRIKELYKIESFLHFAYLMRKDLNVQNSVEFLYKTKKSMFFKNTFISASKATKEIYRINMFSFLNKIKTSLRIQDNKVFIRKESKVLNVLYNIFFANKSKYNTRIFDNNLNIYKEYKYANIKKYNDTDLIKIMFQTMLLKENHAILFVNKINKPSFTFDLLNFIHKKHKDITDGYLDTYSVIKVPFELFRIENLLCDKLSKDLRFSAIINQFAIKSQIKLWFIHENIFVNKNIDAKYLDKTNLIERKNKEFFINETEFVYKTVKGLFIDKEEEWINNHKELFKKDTILEYQRYKYAGIFQQEWLYNNLRYVFLHNDEPVVRKYQDLTISDTTDFANFYKTAEKYKDEEHLTIEKNIFLNQTEDLIRYNDFPSNFYEQYFVDRDMLLNIFPEADSIYKIIKEMGISTDSKMDWAWVHQEDEPFDDPFKIDELLLPENDTKYEDLEDIIFNRKTLKPRNPVKIIDDYTFIAKFPTTYPIKDKFNHNAYKNIALEYLDVRTSIMRRVFLAYYKVWQDHIFEFSRMTMQQSAKKILDYLYVWILMYFPTDEIPEALRVFRQVRWYLERAIIECSEYYVTYEPDNLTSGRLSTSDLDIPSDLYPTDGSPANNTMYIDTTLHVIRNRPDKLRDDEPSITFYIDNPRDTNISFDLATECVTHIELNGTEIDLISLPTQSKMGYNIPYTGDVNEFTIKVNKLDNTGNIFIGNIIIPGMGSNGNLNIEFNPVLQGNKVLNNVSLRIISYVNLRDLDDNNDKILENLTKGNIHLDEAYQTMQKYWELHWQDKDKGKRLTIKRT